MYLLKHETEYGEVNYVTDNLDNNPLEFKTISEAEKKAEELLDMEYDDFGSAITKYYITEVRDEPLKYIKSFKVCDDGKECILSCTDDLVDQLIGSIEEVKKQYDIEFTSDRTYSNGSRVVKFSYKKKKENSVKPKEENYAVILKIEDNVFKASYKMENRMEMSALAYAMKDKYKDELSYFCDERINNSGFLTFKLTNKKKEFKEDFLKCAKIFFKVKVVE